MPIIHSLPITQVQFKSMQLMYSVQQVHRAGTPGDYQSTGGRERRRECVVGEVTESSHITVAIVSVPILIESS